jgi:hypothetical protein
VDTAEVRGLFLQKDPNFPPADLDFLMARLDPDRSGSVSWAEFQRTVVSGAEVLEFVNEVSSPPDRASDASANRS